MSLKLAQIHIVAVQAVFKGQALMRLKWGLPGHDAGTLWSTMTCALPTGLLAVSNVMQAAVYGSRTTTKPSSEQHL